MKKSILRSRILLTFLLPLLLASPLYAEPGRTLASTERGSIFSIPTSPDWKLLNAFVGSPSWETYFNNLNADALKIKHIRFQWRGERDNYQFYNHQSVKELNAAEIAAGRDPFLVTARGGKPVYFLWSCNPNSAGICSLPEKEWLQVIDVRNTTYRKLWREEALKLVSNGKNVAIGVDTYIDRMTHFGTIENNQFNPIVTFDLPFPQNQEAYSKSWTDFMKWLMVENPEIKVMVNTASIAPRGDQQRSFKQLYNYIPSLMTERVLDTSLYGSSKFGRQAFRERINNHYWFLNNANVLSARYCSANSSVFCGGKRIGLLRGIVDGVDLRRLNISFEDGIMSQIAGYLLVRGPNCLAHFSIRNLGGLPGDLREEEFKPIISEIGNGKSPPKFTGSTSDFIVTRKFENGLVVANISDTVKTVKVSKGYLQRIGTGYKEYLPFLQIKPMQGIVLIKVGG